VRADSHDGPELELQIEAGSIDANRLSPICHSPLATHGRSIDFRSYALDDEEIVIGQGKALLELCEFHRLA
jgi:hypothetical protein